MRVDIGDGVRLFFDVAGSSLEPTDEEMVDRPTLLLLHGGPRLRPLELRHVDRFAGFPPGGASTTGQRGGQAAAHRVGPRHLGRPIVYFCDALGIER